MLAGSLLFGALTTVSLTAESLPASAATVVNTIPVGNEPQGISSDGTHVWVAAANDDSVTELNASDGSLVNVIDMGAGSSPDAVSSDGIHVWVANYDSHSVTELNASDGAKVATIPVGNRPSAVSSDGTRVWVANESGNTVTELNASDGATVGTIPVGNRPERIYSDGTYVWVPNYGDNTVTELNASDGSTVDTIPVGTQPCAVSSNDTQVWVTNFWDNTVSEIAVQYPQAPPTFTSGSSTTFTVGSPGTFTVSATSTPAPTFSESGPLPSGVTFTSAGVLSGTPAAGTGGSYPFIINATDGVGPRSTQSFTLAVDEAPSITSGDSASFAVGTNGTSTMTASGYPAPTFTETGSLPDGLTLSSAGVLSGMPLVGPAGNYPITITASNGTSPDATQSFTVSLTVPPTAPPVITSANSTTFIAGSADTFTVTATGYPAPTFSETGSLPSGVTFDSSTGVLSGTPALGGGRYLITITATNGTGTAATQSFTLTLLDPGYQFLALAKTTGVVGNSVDKVKTSGFPVGDTVVAQECDATVDPATDVSTHCDPSTRVIGTAKATSRVSFPSGVTMKVASDYSDSSGGTCAPGGTCVIVVNDVTSTFSVFQLAERVTLAATSAEPAKTTGVVGNYVDKVKTSGFPIGDTVVAQECDATVDPATDVSTHCDPSTRVTGIVAASGRVAFPSGVTMKVASDYSDSSGGTCAPGGTCVLVVNDVTSTFPMFQLADPVTLAATSAKPAKTTGVVGGYVDKVKSTGFPIGDTVMAQECDATVDPATDVSTHCDPATRVTGTVAASGKVVFPTGVTIEVGAAYVESGGGSCPSGGACDLVVVDSTTSGLSVVAPVALR